VTEIVIGLGSDFFDTFFFAGTRHTKPFWHLFVLS